MRLNLHYGHDINTGVFQRITRSLDNQVTAPLNDIRSAATDRHVCSFNIPHDLPRNTTQ